MKMDIDFEEDLRAAAEIALTVVNVCATELALRKGKRKEKKINADDNYTQQATRQQLRHFRSTAHCTLICYDTLRASF
jgi:hypothetical protein